MFLALSYDDASEVLGVGWDGDRKGASACGNIIFYDLEWFYEFGPGVEVWGGFYCEGDGVSSYGSRPEECGRLRSESGTAYEGITEKITIE